MAVTTHVSAPFNQGVFAILRASDGARLGPVIDTIVGSGMRAVEVTLTTPGALEAIGDARTRYGEDALVGAGTVLDGADVRRAVEAGAQFCVSPITDVDMIAACLDAGVPAIPGTHTPTEMMTAARAGATACKVFPSRPHGVDFVRQVLAPLPQLRLVPTGGVGIDEVEAYLRAGAVAVGLGASLVSDALTTGDPSGLAQRCREALAAAGATQRR